MPADTSLTILGPSSLSAGQIQSWLADNGKQSAYVAATIDQIVSWYISEGDAQGVRGDVAFAQACLETGYFTNADTAINNFAGLGHPVSAASGLAFPTPQDGVRAQIQLLARVVGGNGVSLAKPDEGVTWGGRQASTWGGLSGNWAADPNYGQSIIAVYNSMLGGSPVQFTDPTTGFKGSVQTVSTPPPPASPTNVQPGQIPGVDPAWTASADVTVATFQWPLGATPSGAPAAETLAAAVTVDSTVDLQNGQLSEIQLTVIDPDRSLTGGIPGLLNQDSGDVGPYMLWGKDVLVVAETQTLDTDRIPSMILTLRTGCLQWMATKRVQKVWNGLSATEWVEQCVSEYNNQLPSGVPPATFLGQVKAPYAGGIMANPSMPITQWMSYYDIAQQLCYDEGCWLFESGGCVVFGDPEWIVLQAPTVKIGYRDLPGYPSQFPIDPQAIEALNYPNCLRSVSLFTGDTMQVEVPRSLGEQMRVGQQIQLSGVPYWSGKKWIVTGVQFQYDGGRTPVQIMANEAKNPVAASPGGVPPSPPQSDPTGHPATATNLQFVQVAETQVGVPYVWGGELAGVGFDCSGLVQWALGQLDIAFPRTSGEQWSACAAVAGAVIPVDLASITNGALLFVDSSDGTPGGEHVAISLGQTRNGGSEVRVFQAPQPGQRVSSAWVNISYFNRAATIPWLNYGTGSAAG